MYGIDCIMVWGYEAAMANVLLVDLKDLHGYGYGYCLPRQIKRHGLGVSHFEIVVTKGQATPTYILDRNRLALKSYPYGFSRRRTNPD
jgi:hypothetical protein